MNTYRGFLIPAALLTLLGCEVPPPQDPIEPDFLPQKPVDIPGPVGFCKRVGASLEVIVKNQGFSAAPAFVIVEFPHDGSRSGSTESIPPDETRSVTVNIPEPIPPGDFSFKIIIDPDDDVREVREDNNSAEGRCIT
jgi:hypothetical protein